VGGGGWKGEWVSGPKRAGKGWELGKALEGWRTGKADLLVRNVL
jgi:hypothetical protein